MSQNVCSCRQQWTKGGGVPSLARDEALAKRLLLFVGKSATMKVGRLIPGFAIAFNSISNRRDTNRLARRAIKFYGG